MYNRLRLNFGLLNQTRMYLKRTGGERSFHLNIKRTLDILIRSTSVYRRPMIIKYAKVVSILVFTIVLFKITIPGLVTYALRYGLDVSIICISIFFILFCYCTVHRTIKRFCTVRVCYVCTACIQYFMQYRA